MKKSIQHLISKFEIAPGGMATGGFASIKGGAKFDFPSTNNFACPNTGTCTGTNSDSCTNSKTCTDTTNSKNCTNSGTC
ncbi:MAG: hypothetical protein M3O71_07255 [Bacteroidota bacterium]|nr:hypothetical protein [Bacteroidota bacterium]